MDKAVARLLPPESASLAGVAQEFGVSIQTLEKWRDASLLQPAGKNQWTAAARFEALLTTTAMKEQDRSAWCHAHGVFPQQLVEWRQSATEALGAPQTERSSPAQAKGRPAPHQGTRARSAPQRQGVGRDRGIAGAFKKTQGDLPKGRGRIIGLEDHRQLVDLIQEAHSNGASLYKACQSAGITVRTLQRWQTANGATRADAQPEAVRPTPGHSLSEAERAKVLSIVNEQRFADQPPARIVPALADEGRYVSSESTFYLILRAQGQNAHRGRAKAPQASRSPTTHVASGPRQRSGAGT